MDNTQIIKNYNLIRKNFNRYCATQPCNKTCIFWIDEHNCKGVKTLNNYAESITQDNHEIKEERSYQPSKIKKLYASVDQDGNTGWITLEQFAEQLWKQYKENQDSIGEKIEIEGNTIYMDIVGFSVILTCLDENAIEKGTYDFFANSTLGPIHHILTFLTNVIN